MPSTEPLPPPSSLPLNSPTRVIGDVYLDTSADDERKMEDEALSDQRSRLGQSEMLLHPISRVNYKPFLFVDILYIKFT